MTVIKNSKTMILSSGRDVEIGFVFKGPDLKLMDAPASHKRIVKFEEECVRSSPLNVANKTGKKEVSG